MWRLTELMVRSMLLTAWRLAISPTSTSPDLEKATTDGVVRPPSALAMTVGSPPSRTETTELVVPRSIPTARDIRVSFLCGRSGGLVHCGGPVVAGDEPTAAAGERRLLSLLHSSLLRTPALSTKLSVRRSTLRSGRETTA